MSFGEQKRIAFGARVRLTERTRCHDPQRGFLFGQRTVWVQRVVAIQHAQRFGRLVRCERSRSAAQQLEIASQVALWHGRCGGCGTRCLGRYKRGGVRFGARDDG